MAAYQFYTHTPLSLVSQSLTMVLAGHPVKERDQASPEQGSELLCLALVLVQ